MVDVFSQDGLCFPPGSGKLLHTSIRAYEHTSIRAYEHTSIRAYEHTSIRALWINVLDVLSKRRGCADMHFIFQTDVEEVRLEMFTMLLGLFERAALLIIFLFFLSRVPRFRQILQKGKLRWQESIAVTLLLILCFCHFRDIYGH